MPLFFIHHRTRDSYEPGDVGCLFETLDLAYLDAYRAAIEMSAELLLEHADPSHHVFEIADESGLVLIDIPFAEVLRHKGSRPRNEQQRRELQATIERGRQLRKELKAKCDDARALAAYAHEQMRAVLK